MYVWRITRERDCALDGQEACRSGGRWNSKGVPMVYTSGSLALAALELLAHLDPDRVPDDLVAMRIAVPDGNGDECVGIAELPADWNAVQEHPACMRCGDSWACEKRSVLLRVPSAIVPEEQNILLNPLHADARRLEVTLARPFSFDPRLLR